MNSDFHRSRAGKGAVRIEEGRIRERVLELARQISADSRGQRLHLVCVLRGAYIFCADLSRALEVPHSVDFLAISSYGGGTQTSGDVRLTKDLEHSITGRHVLIVEDIVDTGLTMDYLLRSFRERGPASVRVCSLLSKPARRRVHVPIDYLGFEIENAYVYGYGLDRDELDRGLPEITSLAADEIEPVKR